jgi:methionyl-tRNA formyltransferase
LGIPTLQPTKLKSGHFPGDYATIAPEVAVVVAYGRILPLPILNVPARGSINVHASLLPRWRGAAPINWAILAGDHETGVTTMRMAEGLDTGDVLLMERTPIGERETANELFERLAPLGANLLVRTLAELNSITPQVQPEEGVTYAPMLQREQSPLDWRKSSVALDQQVRGLAPWPGTTATVGGVSFKVLRVQPVEGAGSPGTLLDGARVACGSGALELLEVQAPGKRPVKGVDFVNGTRLVKGVRFDVPPEKLPE